MSRDKPPPSIALLFPGQASQQVGMGSPLWEASAAARAMYALADQVTGLPITQLCADGSLADLTRTEVTQVAVVATSLALAAMLEEHLGYEPPVMAVAGHSVGELTALGWARALTPEETLHLAHERGQLMARQGAAVDGTMVAVLGMEAEALEEVCGAASRQTGNRVQIANLNAPDQIVISGERQAVEVAAQLARAQGAQRAVPLSVGGAFHSVYMEGAARAFAAVSQRVVIRPPRVPIVLNTTGQPSTDPATLRSELPQQIRSPVRWVECVRSLKELGCETFVEVGPGQVLTSLLRRTLPDARALSLNSPDAMPQVAALWDACGITLTP